MHNIQYNNLFVLYWLLAHSLLHLVSHSLGHASPWHALHCHMLQSFFPMSLYLQHHLNRKKTLIVNRLSYHVKKKTSVGGCFKIDLLTKHCLNTSCVALVQTSLHMMYSITLKYKQYNYYKQLRIVRINMRTESEILMRMMGTVRWITIDSNIC